MTRLLLSILTHVQIQSLKVTNIDIMYLRNHPQLLMWLWMKLWSLLLTIIQTCSWIIAPEQLLQLQQEDHFCKRIISLLKSSKLQANNPYYMDDELLMTNITDNKQCFHTMVLSRMLTARMLRASHDQLDHNISIRAYSISRIILLERPRD